MNKPISKYRLLYNPDTDILIIMDECDGTSMSVTNNVENVLLAAKQMLAEQSLDLPVAVIYRDTDGRYDQIVHDDGKFLGFVLLGPFDETFALVKMSASKLIDNVKGFSADRGDVK